MRRSEGIRIYRGRRLFAGLSALAVALLGAVASPSAPAGAAPAVGIVLEYGDLTVVVGDAFPQVVSYEVDGAVLEGQPEALSSFTVNGTARQAVTAVEADVANRKVEYVSQVAGLDLTITSVLEVTSASTVEFRVTSIAGAYEGSVQHLAIPDHRLVTVRSDQAGSALSRAVASRLNDDVHIAITDSAAVDANPVNSAVAFVSTSQLAAAVDSNATRQVAQGTENVWYPVASQVTRDGAVTRGSVWAGTWTWAPTGLAEGSAVARYELPRATVVLAGDANGDSAVDWQDAAIAYRDVHARPDGADKVADRVVQRLTADNHSFMQNPYLETLDNTRRVALNTDGLRQWVLLKGYEGEGQDTVYPDYTGHFERGGGLEEFNAMIDGGGELNAEYGVHIGAIEAYLSATSFSEELTGGGNSLAFNGAEQSYRINQVWDLSSGSIIERLEALKQDAPGLAGVYIDVYMTSGWQADQLAKLVNQVGLEVYTEYPAAFYDTKLWAHWSVDRGFGFSNGYGLGSQMIRFVSNTDADTWNTDVLLGGTILKDFEEWSYENTWNGFYSNLFQTNFPTKFLQHYPIQQWQAGTRAVLSDGAHQVVSSYAAGKRTITFDGVTVLDQNAYLLPWGEAGQDGTSDPGQASKMYYYNTAATPTTWDLTAQFADGSEFELFELGDQGRVNAQTVTAVDGQVTVSGKAGQAYVLVPVGGAQGPSGVVYGQGERLADPHFNNGNLNVWNPVGTAAVAVTASGENIARFGSAASSISQTVTGLEAGQEYSFMAEIEIPQGARREVTVSVQGAGLSERNQFDVNPIPFYWERHREGDGYAHRAQVRFIAPADGEVVVKVAVAVGQAAVSLDDARLMAVKAYNSVLTQPPTPEDGEVVAWEDFESNLPGWGQYFVSGGPTYPTNISHRNDPYTSRSWRSQHPPYSSGALAGLAVDAVVAGNHSLQSHQANALHFYASAGVAYRTIPATLQFEPESWYRVEFDYEVNSNSYSFVTGSGQTSESSRTVIAQALEPTHFSKTFQACGADGWVGVRNEVNESGFRDLLLDNFLVVELEEGPDTRPCGTPVAAQEEAALTAGAKSSFTTTFTNPTDKLVSNVELTLAAPAGWLVETASLNGNLFGLVGAGQTVQTEWLVTAPEAVEGTASLDYGVVYTADCAADETVVGPWAVSVAVGAPSAPSLAKIALTADVVTASSYAPVSPPGGVVDGDVSGASSANWHSPVTNPRPPFPHWLRFDLGGPTEVAALRHYSQGDGLNGSGGVPGRVRDYRIEVSDTGGADDSEWSVVKSGAFARGPVGPDGAWETVYFDAPVTTRYLRLVILNTHPSGGVWQDDEVARVTELELLSADPPDEPVGFTPGARSQAGLSCASAGVSFGVTTSFTNPDDSPATNVELRLSAPDGWTVRTAARDGNLFESVDTGQSVETDWLVAPPLGAEGMVELSSSAVYTADCALDVVTEPTAVLVVVDPTGALEKIALTAEMVTASDYAPVSPPGGAVDGDLSGDSSAHWHSAVTSPRPPFPHWLRFDLGAPTEVAALRHYSKGDDTYGVGQGVTGRVRDYRVEVSDTGGADDSEWRVVKSGAFAKGPAGPEGAWETVYLDAPVTTRYLRLVILNTHPTGVTWQDYTVARVTELELLGLDRSTESSGFAPGARPEADPVCAVVDKTDLSALVAGASALAPGYYTSASWSALQLALSAARVVLVDDAATEAVVSASVAALSDAIGALKPAVTPSVAFKCAAGRVYLAVTVVNNEAQEPVSLVLSGPFGSKSFASVAPGRKATASFNTLTASLTQGGALALTAGAAGVEPVVSGVAYGAYSCGG
ncbi:MAG: endo-alpha-N-acetylgalactosaminidase family protein [Bifidobacteriaceae bacterium]|jgi:endo-alpha-N-acetylgalactosaminidase|nr:endo-alpha-N-acetylgalactosaminidase family protein [Bifidobacteriaceae bacterium]